MSETPELTPQAEALSAALRGEPMPELNPEIASQPNSLDESNREAQNLDSQEIDDTQEIETPTEDDESQASEEPEKVDYKQLIPMADGEKVPLGELKDLAQRGREFDQLETKLRSELKDDRIYMANLKRDLETIATHMQQRGQLDQETMQQMQAVYAQQVAQNGRVLQTLVPEWKDTKQMQADLEVMQEWGASYGVPNELMTSLIDGNPNLTFALHETARLWKMVQGHLRKKVPTNKKPSNKKARRKPSSDKLLKQAADTRNLGDIKAAMGAIVEEGRK